MSTSVDVIFIQRPAELPSHAEVFTRPLPEPAVFGMPIVEPAPLLEREEGFVSAVTRSLLVGVLVGGVVAVALALIFARGILRPTSATSPPLPGAWSAATSRQRVQVGSRDEIGQLASAFNAMADGLARTEQLRRAMVTDVAHELRTPLTNLRGYLEAVRDGVTEPQPGASTPCTRRRCC